MELFDVANSPRLKKLYAIAKKLYVRGGGGEDISIHFMERLCFFFRKSLKSNP